VQVGVADPAVEHLDRDIVVPRNPEIGISNKDSINWY